MTAPWIVVTGLDGSGKSTLVATLAQCFKAHAFRLPYHDFVHTFLNRSGNGTPFGDVHTDRLLFALDARLANYQIQDMRRTFPYLVSQRGWMDNFIFGAVQGVSYEETEAMLRTFELQRSSANIFLNTEPGVALSRLQTNATKDKYETAQFLALQYVETERFFGAVEQSHPALNSFLGIPSIYIDTTAKSHDETFMEAENFLRRLENGLFYETRPSFSAPRF